MKFEYLLIILMAFSIRPTCCIFTVNCTIRKMFCKYTDTIEEQNVGELVFVPTCFSTNTTVSGIYINELLIRSFFVHAIPTSIFTTFPNLVNLKVGFQMVVLEPGTFVNATHLRYLDLDRNNLTELKAKIFQGANQLREIHLTKNCITHIEEDTFNHLQYLEVLDLSLNRLIELPETVFHPLPNLLRIYLFGNPLFVIHKELFANNLLLTDIHFQPCKLAAIHRETFSHLHHLSNLFLRKNDCIDKEYLAYDYARDQLAHIEDDLRKCSLAYEEWKSGKSSDIEEKIVNATLDIRCCNCDAQRVSKTLTPNEVQAELEWMRNYLYQ